MKSQVHNQGELKELKVKIEKSVVECLEKMATNSNMPIEELVVIALKRYRESHLDYLGKKPGLD
jgi:fructose-1,6-bisphosphatase/sedoheptulose 1,7-bisphosphatase-like protein